jgi:hypothetical protein
VPAIRCSHNGVRHTHDTVDDVRACQTGRAATPSPGNNPAPRPFGHRVGREVVHTDAPATDAQVSYLVKLGARKYDATRLTRLQASNLIERYKRERETNVTAPAPQVKPKTIVPIALLEQVRDGRYAVRPDANADWMFFRVSRPKYGKMKGCLKVQTQHGEELYERMTVYPSGQVWVAPSGYKWTANEVDNRLLLVVVDQRQAAIDYGREIGRCCRCGKELTDERSRHYGIGPECEKVWPEIIRLVDEQDQG